MANDTPDSPGPLIWVVLLVSAIAGAIWGLGVAVAAFVGTTALFVLIGMALKKRYKLNDEGNPVPVAPGAEFDERMANAASRDERRWIFARELSQNPQKLIEEVEGTIDWFATMAAGIAQQESRGSEAQSHLLRHVHRGAAIASYSKLMVLRDNAETRLCAGLLLHHVAPLMTMTVLRLSDEMILEAVEKEQRDFKKFVETCSPGVAEQINSTLDLSDRVAASFDEESHDS